MDRKIRICIADDNTNITDNMAKYLDKNPNMKVVKKCNNGEETIQAMLEDEIDILIIDMIMPKIDGIGVIDKIYEEVKNGNIKNKPGIIIVSAIVHEYLKFNIFGRGVNYYMTKPIDLEVLEERIIEIYEGINNPIDKKIEKAISAKLYELGVYPNLVGYKYIKESIEMIVGRPDIAKNFRQNIYTKMAEENKIAIFTIEKSINNAIVTAWNKEKNKMTLFLKRNVYEKKAPSARIFITAIADEIRNEI